MATIDIYERKNKHGWSFLAVLSSNINIYGISDTKDGSVNNLLQKAKDYSFVVEYDSIPEPIPITLDEVIKLELQHNHGKLWGKWENIEPKLLKEIYGDGKRLLYISPLSDRPNHYMVRIDSVYPDENKRNEVEDILEYVVDSIVSEFGWCEVEGEEDEETIYLPWPSFDGIDGYECQIMNLDYPQYYKPDCYFKREGLNIIRRIMRTNHKPFVKFSDELISGEIYKCVSCAICHEPILLNPSGQRWANKLRRIGWQRHGKYWQCPECKEVDIYSKRE